MLYLQGLCGSAIADGDENRKFIWEKIEEILKYLKPKWLGKKEMTMCLKVGKVGSPEDPENTDDSLPIDECFQVLMDLVEMNLSVLKGIDPSDLDESIRTKLMELTGGKQQLIIQTESLNLADKEATRQYMEQYNEGVCDGLSHCFSFEQEKKPTKGRLFLQTESLKFTEIEDEKLHMETYTMEVKSLRRWFNFQQHKNIVLSIIECMSQWKWGRNYNFLHNMKDKAVPSTLLESETRDYEDSAILLNSPYFSVLRQERHIDLIISLDFSDGDPFKTVRDAAETCGKLNIPFPEVNIPKGDEKKPKDFYVFKGPNAPTVIHIPLFNSVNCREDIEAWRNRYKTIDLHYTADMITDLMDVAGLNISNNRDSLKEQIGLAIKKHK